MTVSESDAVAAFETLYRQTSADVLAYLVRRTGEAEDAADMLAETYLIAWRKLSAIPPGDEARLWLFGVARNVVLRGVRRRRVADALVDRLAIELRTAVAPAAAEEEQPLHALEAALGQLNERDREIMLLTAWEGLAPREISAVLGVSANAVRIRLHRARARLSRELATSQVVPARCAPIADA